MIYEGGGVLRLFEVGSVRYISVRRSSVLSFASENRYTSSTSPMFFVCCF